MEDHSKLSRIIEYLIHKRHNSISHIQKTLEKDGAFWMNSVKIDRASFSKHISEIKHPKELKKSIERFYYLGVSLGKVIKLGNAINAIQMVAQVMEEYEIYSEKSHVEASAIIRHILPSSVESVVALTEKQERLFQKKDDYNENLRVKDQVFSSNDQIETVRKPPLQQEGQSPIKMRGGQYNHHSQPHSTYEEQKVSVRVKPQIQIAEQHFNNEDDFKQWSIQMKTHINILVNERQVVKLNASEIDVKTPNFRVLSCHSIPINLDYTQVVKQLLDILILLYNKLMNEQYILHVAYKAFKRVDEKIVVSARIRFSLYQDKVLKVICQDICLIALKLTFKQLGKVNKALKMDNQPGGRIALRGIMQEDQNFQIPQVDLHANEQFDLKLMSSVQASIKTDSYGQGGTHR